jgi:hypothetical protein
LQNKIILDRDKSPEYNAPVPRLLYSMRRAAHAHKTNATSPPPIEVGCEAAFPKPVA